MAKTNADSPTTPKSNVDLPKTQRAYTLRLRGADASDHSWRDALWATHEAVNKGAKVFGNWLLTLRGGLCHTLADAKVPQGKGKPDHDPTAEERRGRRILLALSWLSVESAPKNADTHNAFVIASGTDSSSSRNEKVVRALREILEKRGVKGAGLKGWIADCEPSLSASIRDDAAWVDRSAAFDAARQRVGDSLTRDEVWDMLGPFFGGPETYLAPLKPVDEGSDSDTASEDKAKDLVQKAGQWLSSRFGTGKGADFAQMSKVYGAIAAWATKAQGFSTGSKAMASLAKFLSASDVDGILDLISGPGYKSATRNIIKAMGARESQITKQDIDKLHEAALDDSAKCKHNTGGKGPRPWSDTILKDVEAACGFTYLQANGPARHSEFAVMLDHAARRVSIGHSWIKRSESERQEFEADARRIDAVPSDAKAWLDQFCQARSGVSGALDAYRIRKRAVEGWKEVVARWDRTACKTPEDRIAAARETQADPDIDKFGDIQLFEALASDDAVCVWQTRGEPTAQPLIDYANATDAQAKQQRFKVPAYRHPDPLAHPVFCDFGNSRWDIRFAVHEAAKAASKNKKKKGDPRKSDWLKDRHALRMGLWNGQKLDDSLPLRWSCKRLAADMALRQHADDPTNTVAVTRADRLGRAAAGAQGDSSIEILGVFDEDHWNGRLQAPRTQLDAIAQHVAQYGWDAKANRMRSRIRWLVSFSAKLQPAGLWVAYAAQFSDDDPAKPFVSRKGEYAVKHQGNDKRQGGAKLVLSRLPGLRVLSVDLGHRYAAACAVWATVTIEEINAACQAANHTPPAESDMYLHLASTGMEDKKRTVVYRRIGADILPDPKTGKPTRTPHPAPWARLDRQFLIKLPGEEVPARAASNKGDTNETRLVADFAKRLGLVADDDRTKDRAVDELMSRAVRIARLGLVRHARRAKIAYALDPNTKGIPGMGGSEKAFTPGDAAHIKFLTDALFDWHSLASESKWDDKPARELWNRYIVVPMDRPLTVAKPKAGAKDADDRTRPQRRKDDDALREQLKPLARQLATVDRAEMHKSWNKLWNKDDGTDRTKDDFEHALIRNESGKVIGSRTAPKQGKESAGGWHEHLRFLTDWIMGWHLPGSNGDGWKQNVGGLSVARIATMKSLYQLHKAFAMRAKPDKPRGAPEKDETNAGVAQSILDGMERMREQRVKQLASRIAGSALGLGGHWKQVERHDRQKRVRLGKDGKPLMKWVWIEEPSAKYPPCHAIVIENLTNYRPDELQTRRENRQLMDWSSSKVKKHLSEACQLHGLHLREVQAGYTSRQDSRTGAPGIRCTDIPVTDFISKPWWRRQVKIAQEKTGHHKGDARDRYIVDLDARWSAASEAERKAAPPVRVPVAGSDLFVSADPQSPAAKGLQADLNAAANIGLKALLDPDWPGKWWYVPCSTKDGKPSQDKVKGAMCLYPEESLLDPTSEPGHRTGDKTKKKEIVNVWRDPSMAPVAGRWEPTPAYWNTVRCRVIDVLRHANGLTKAAVISGQTSERHPSNSLPVRNSNIEPTEIPW